MPRNLLSKDLIAAMFTGAFLGFGFAYLFLRTRHRSSKKIVRRRSREDSDNESSDGYWEDDSSEERYKMVMVVNTALGMTKGKIAAQCCHGCLGAYKKAPKDVIDIWSSQGQMKIAVKGQNEDDLRLVSAFCFYPLIITNHSSIGCTKSSSIKTSFLFGC